MKNLKKIKGLFLGVILSEVMMVIGMIISFFVIRNMNEEISSSLGNPSDIGYGWGFIFGGWTLYFPLLFVFLGFILVFFVSAIFRVFYSISSFNILKNSQRYVYFLIISWIIYLIVPFLLLMNIFSLNVLMIGIVLVAIDLCIIYLCYSKLISAEEKCK